MATHEELSGTAALVADARDLARTVVAPTLEIEHRNRTNLLHAATVELAWRRLTDFTGGRPRLEPADEIAEALSRAADAFTDEDLDAESYVARAAVGPGGLDEIRAELSAKFGDAAAPAGLPAAVGEGDLVLYAYLFKHLAFATPFARQEFSGLRFAGKEVQHFGVLPGGDERLAKARGQQVTIHDHRSDADFVVELATRSRGDRLIVARIPPAGTLAGTVEAAMKRAAGSLLGRLVGGRLRPQDELRIPIADFELARSYEELVGKRIVGRGEVIAGADQSIRFRLDEEGALLKSEMTFTAPRGGLGLSLSPRRFVCDGPFLILLARVGRTRPYFAMWIEDPELLVVAKPMPVQPKTQRVFG
jgi:hypothetical protein